MWIVSLMQTGRRRLRIYSVGGYSSLSEEAGDAFLDKEVEKGEIAKCVRKL